MNTLYEGILGDIDKNIDKMDVDAKIAMFDVEFKSFKEFVNILSKFLKVKPTIEKDYNKWNVTGSTMGKRCTGQKVATFLFDDKKGKPVLIRVGDFYDSISIQYASGYQGHHFIWFDYKYNCGESFLQRLNFIASRSKDSTAYKFKELINNYI